MFANSRYTPERVPILAFWITEYEKSSTGRVLVISRVRWKCRIGIGGQPAHDRLMRLANMLPAIAPVAVLSVVKAVGPDEAERFRVASNLGSFDL